MKSRVLQPGYLLGPSLRKISCHLWNNSTNPNYVNRPLIPGLFPIWSHVQYPKGTLLAYWHSSSETYSGSRWWFGSYTLDLDLLLSRGGSYDVSHVYASWNSFFHTLFKLFYPTVHVIVFIDFYYIILRLLKLWKFCEILEEMANDRNIPTLTLQVSWIVNKRDSFNYELTWTEDNSACI